MPSANGVYTLPTGYLAVTGTTIQASQHNPPLEDIATALTARVSRDGTAPMSGQFKLADGTVGLPGLVFNSDQTTGVYKTATGFAVAVSGAKVVEFVPGGIKGARFIGELIPLTLTTPPALCVLPYGQTLSRTAYPDLWSVAQTEIAAGNTFYNNGDGISTFGIGDLRGRGVAAKDNMGGSAAGRLTNAVFSPDGQTLGGTGGAQNKALATANLPPYTPAGIITNATYSFEYGAQNFSGTGSNSAVNALAASGISGGTNVGLTLQTGATFAGTAQGGTSTPFPTMGPTLLVNYALYAGA